MWGVIPAAGRGLRIQPLGCSKELLPVGYRIDGGTRRPKAVSEFLLDRLVLAGATRLCLVVSPDKLDIVEYYGDRFGTVPIVYAVQGTPAGLCDAIFRATSVADGGDVLFGLPDTIWFPDDALARLPAGQSSLLLFPVARPEHFDAVVAGPDARVREVQVKVPSPSTSWVWGAGRIAGDDFGRLYDLWVERRRQDEYLGTLLNAFIARGGHLLGVRGGERYLDVGTYEGYCAAMQLTGGAGDQSARMSTQST